MDNWQFYGYLFLLLYVIIFWWTFFSRRRKLLKKKSESIAEIDYLVEKFGFDKKDINCKREIAYIAMLNSFIMSSVGTFLVYLKMHIFFKLSIGFILLLALTYSLYEIYGRHLEKKIRRDKDEF